jgi:hypothetical protein
MSSNITVIARDEAILIRYIERECVAQKDCLVPRNDDKKIKSLI